MLLLYFLDKLAMIFVSVNEQVIQVGLGERHNKIDCKV